MPRTSEFVDYLVEQLVPLGEVSAKSMFGGWGIFREGRMFALVADETLYIKVDDVSRAEFEREKLRPFRYKRRDQGEATLPYYEAPTAALDHRELLCEWGRKGVEAATRAAAKQRPKSQKRK